MLRLAKPSGLGPETLHLSIAARDESIPSIGAAFKSLECRPVSGRMFQDGPQKVDTKCLPASKLLVSREFCAG